MDAFQALSLIGFDGPDSSSTEEEILAEIDRLESVPGEHHPELTARIAALKEMLAQKQMSDAPVSP